MVRPEQPLAAGRGQHRPASRFTPAVQPTSALVFELTCMDDLVESAIFAFGR